MTETGYTIPGMDHGTAADVIRILDDRMVSLIDLSLTLKHVHWNVVGRDFIAVHEMLDPQVDAVRAMVDQIAERIATLGGTPVGTPGALVERRRWDDYDVRRAPVPAHLIALDGVYTGVIADHREAQRALADADPVSEDLVISHLHELELFQWFIRAHLENAEGVLQTSFDDAVAAS
jgi:starvation-inducible DNA-binding protein